MAYRKVYFRIQTYAYGYDSGWSSEADEAAFDNECCGLFQQLGWTLHPGSNGGCDTVTKDRQDLYLHPFKFSGVMDEASMGVTTARPDTAKEQALGGPRVCSLAISNSRE